MVAFFSPPELSLIFLGGMDLEVISLYPIMSLDNVQTTCFQVSRKFSSYYNTRHCHSSITIIVSCVGKIFCINNYCDWRTTMLSIKFDEILRET